MSDRNRVLKAVLTLAILGGFGFLFVYASLLRSRISTNETGMIGTLGSLSTCQERFKEANIRDVDGDGTGEYGYLEQLAEEGFLVEPFAESARENDGDVVHRGYRFRLFLPLADGSPRRAVHPLPSFTAADADNQETNWVCYAWPVDLNTSGNRCAVVNQEGQVYQCANTVHGWDGEGGARSGSEAFSAANDMTGPIVVGSPSADGQTWTPV